MLPSLITNGFPVIWQCVWLSCPAWVNLLSEWRQNILTQILTHDSACCKELELLVLLVLILLIVRTRRSWWMQWYCTVGFSSAAIENSFKLPLTQLGQIQLQAPKPFRHLLRVTSSHWLRYKIYATSEWWMYFDKTGRAERSLRCRGPSQTHQMQVLVIKPKWIKN
jgi:hypothetical protein